MLDTQCPDCGAPLRLPEKEAWSLDRIHRLCDKCKERLLNKQEESNGHP